MAFDAFLKIDSIDGESPDDKHKNEVQLAGFKFEMTQTASVGAGSGAGSGKIKMGDFEFLAPIGKQTVLLQNACETGKHITSAVMSIREAGGTQQDYYKVTLSDCVVTSYKVGVRPGADWIIDPDFPQDGLLEIFAIAFSKIEREYSPQKSDGSLDSPVKGGYDVKANKTV